MSETPRTDEVMKWAHGKVHSARADDLEDLARGLECALQIAESWIMACPHGDNCYVSAHYEGDPGDQCNCGKESVLATVSEALRPS